MYLTRMLRDVHVRTISSAGITTQVHSVELWFITYDDGHTHALLPWRCEHA